jgi:all-trans-retinol 13,14-reductase
MSGLLLDHFAKGGYYPTGGSSVFAESFLPSILANNGRALVRAPVSRILLSSDGKTAIGVTVKYCILPSSHPPFTISPEELISWPQ